MLTLLTHFLIGTKDALRYSTTIPGFRKKHLSCALLSAFIWLTICLFKYMFMPSISWLRIDARVENWLSNAFSALWVVPLMLTSKIVNTFWFMETAEFVYQATGRKKKAPGAKVSEGIADLIFALIVYVVFMIQASCTIAAGNSRVSMGLFYGFWFSAGGDDVFDPMTAGCAFGVLFPMSILAAHLAKSPEEETLFRLRIFGPTVFVADKVSATLFNWVLKKSRNQGRPFPLNPKSILPYHITPRITFPSFFTNNSYFSLYKDFDGIGMRSWGEELWDSFEKVDSKFSSRIKYNENIIKFIKDKNALDSEYAKNIKSLVARNRKSTPKSEFTSDECFFGWLTEVENIANQYEMIVESVQKTCIARIQSHTNEMMKHKNESRTEHKNWIKMLENLDSNQEKAKQNWAKKLKDYEKARSMFEKADSDQHVTKADVEKARQNSHHKRQMAEDAKNEYSRCLVEFNRHQKEHHTKLIPDLLNTSQNLALENGNCFREIVKNFCVAECSYRPLIAKCIDDIDHKSGSIDPEADCETVIEMTKTGYARPDDKPFEDMENPPKETGKKTLRGLGFGLFKKTESKPVQEDMSHLPPQQRKRQLMKVRKSLLDEMEKDTKEIKSLEKMASVKNFGDGGQVQQKINEARNRLNAKNQKLHQINEWLNDTEIALNGKPLDHDTDHMATEPQGYQYKHEVKQEYNQMDTSYSEQSGSQMDVSRHSGYRDSFEEESIEGPVATCLYNFQEAGEGCITVNMGEILSVTEEDNGDGWTKVRVHGTNREGFVPTSYIKLN
ncbi:Oidioi.mRNA.OKI2018_I69.PAR.g12815.t2.cds [Oikopleura dioica]|uniref:Oidioi.mRNA.OKI2018_I69.PAR.g12815.t2.cds n=1 Tax=Oikopleura dioica TaxID=34765 RepID=A0ABN7S9I2_OIKDI|nr:Oidioi.mRNA.OKI2018_I69.PAR.g12815.t2.cds [Oikopleura dioica]